MTIRFLCPLGHPLAVPDGRAGKKGRCPICRQRVYVPRLPEHQAISDDEIANLLSESEDDEDADESEDLPEREEMFESEDGSAESPAPRTSRPTTRPTASPQSATRQPFPPQREAATESPSSGKSNAKPLSRAAAQNPPEPSSVAATSPLPDDPPGSHHAWLHQLVGDWTYRLKLWLPPGDDPSTGSGSAASRLILDQRFVQIKSQGMLLGASFNSLWTLGYDQAKQTYTSLYLDDHSTSFFHAEGHANEDGKTLQLFGSMHDAPLNGHSSHNRAYLYAIHVAHPDQWTLQVQDVLRGEMLLEIVYTRKK